MNYLNGSLILVILKETIFNRIFLDYKKTNIYEKNQFIIGNDTENEVTIEIKCVTYFNVKLNEKKIVNFSKCIILLK